MNLVLNIKKRENETPNQLRQEGKIPLVMYGPEQESVPVYADAIEFSKVLRQAGTSTIIVLKGVDSDKEALIYDVQLHPVKSNPIHADLYIIKRGQKVSVEIPLEYVGEAPAEKAGFMVVKQLHEIEISVRPSEIPQQIEVDLSKLQEEGDTILIKDLPLPESAEPELDPEEIVANVVAVQQEQEAAEESEQVDMDSIEVEQKGKKEDSDAQDSPSAE